MRATAEMYARQTTVPTRDVNEDAQAIVHATLLGDGWAAAGLGVGIISEEGQYVACNDALCDLTGYSRSELLEMNAGATLPADDAARRNFEKAATGKRPWGFGQLRRKDSMVIGVNYWLAPTVVASIPYFVVLLWADGKGPDLRTGAEAAPAKSKNFSTKRVVQSQAEQPVRRAKKRRGSPGA